MTTTATIRRGQSPKKRATVKRHTRPAIRTRSAARTLLERLPISASALRRIGRFVVGLVIVACAAGALYAAGVPAVVGTELGEAAGRAGFAVKRIDVRGINNMERLPVYAVALDQDTVAMPLVDLDAIRARLMTFPWIKDARVSRRLPDTLVVEVVERTPAALWQNGRRLFLVDGEGVALREVHPDAVPTLPTLAGPGAERRVHDLGSLLEAAPRLRPLLANANWIGDRRWDLRFHTGETLALPEGMEPAQRALRRFADMDQRRQLLGGNFVRFDMRIEGRMIVRLKPGQNGELPAVAPPVAAGQSPEEMARTI